MGLACSSPLEAGIVEQVEYLVNRHKADVTITDTNGNNAVSIFHSSCSKISI